MSNPARYGQDADALKPCDGKSVAAIVAIPGLRSVKTPMIASAAVAVPIIAGGRWHEGSRRAVMRDDHSRLRPGAGGRSFLTVSHIGTLVVALVVTRLRVSAVLLQSLMARALVIPGLILTGLILTGLIVARLVAALLVLLLLVTLITALLSLSALLLQLTLLRALLLKLLMLRPRETAIVVEQAEIVLGVLEVALGSDPIAGGLSVAREGEIFFENLIRVAADPDIGSARVESLRADRQIGVVGLVRFAAVVTASLALHGSRCRVVGTNARERVSRDGRRIADRFRLKGLVLPVRNLGLTGWAIVMPAGPAARIAMAMRIRRLGAWP
jgi:hypothetical protein